MIEMLINLQKKLKRQKKLLEKHFQKAAEAAVKAAVLKLLKKPSPISKSLSASMLIMQSTY